MLSIVYPAAGGRFPPVHDQRLQPGDRRQMCDYIPGRDAEPGTERDLEPIADSPGPQRDGTEHRRHFLEPGRLPGSAPGRRHEAQQMKFVFAEFVVHDREPDRPRGERRDQDVTSG